MLPELDEALDALFEEDQEAAVALVSNLTAALNADNSTSAAYRTAVRASLDCSHVQPCLEQFFTYTYMTVASIMTKRACHLFVLSAGEVATLDLLLDAGDDGFEHATGGCEHT